MKTARFCRFSNLKWWCLALLNIKNWNFAERQIRLVYLQARIFFNSDLSFRVGTTWTTMSISLCSSCKKKMRLQTLRLLFSKIIGLYKIIYNNVVGCSINAVDLYNDWQSVYFFYASSNGMGKVKPSQGERLQILSANINYI